MSERRLSDDALREAFQWLPVLPAHECTPEDLDRIARALDGELPAVERRKLVERLSTEPALAEAWRAAHQLRAGLPSGGSARAEVPGARGTRSVKTAAIEPRRPAWRPASWVAAAAVAVLAIAAVLVPRYRPSEGTLRGAGAYAIESRLADEAALPRDGFRLQWSPGPQDSRYLVRVTAEDLQLLTAVADLSEPELVVGAATLTNVAPGSRIFWQVEALLPGGERVVSPTFVVRVQSGP